jgi:glycosyltransferase involved in cell wall biosynthesis
MLANATLRTVPRILLDATRLLYRRVTGSLPTGIDRVGLEYVREYGGKARAVLSLGPFSALLSAADSQTLFRRLLVPAEPARALALKLVVKAVLWRWLVPAARGDILVNTSHTGLENAHYGATLRRRGARALLMVHDLIPITHPEYCRPREQGKHRTRMCCAARVGAAIVANSQHTLDEFNRFCRAEGLAPPCERVAKLGVGLPRLDPGASPLERPYFVVLGTLEPRKNHAMLLHLWRKLAETHGDAAPTLVVIGQRGWECENVVDLLERCRPLQRVVIEKSHCTDAELATWLAHARALLFPSFAEGYGLPVCEAMAMGVPVIASDLPAFRETVGDIPDYADPLDGARWESLVMDYAHPRSAFRSAQLERMRNYQPVTWAQHFAIVGALIAELRSEGAVGVPAGSAAGTR